MADNTEKAFAAMGILLNLLEVAQKVGSIIKEAQAQNRDVSDDELDFLKRTSKSSIDALGKTLGVESESE